MPTSSAEVELSSNHDDQPPPSGRWLVGTRCGEPGAGSWGTTDGWDEPHGEPLQGEYDPFPGGSLINSNMNHIRQDLRMAPLTWNGRTDRPAHLDGENSETWARLQRKCLCMFVSLSADSLSVYACSLAAQRCHAAFPTFTGLQIETRLASIEEELSARKLEHVKRSEEADALLLAYNKAVAERREVEKRVEQLVETSQKLQSLRAIALIHFPPGPA